ncbi:hypothetical protein OBB02_00305 [Candidatus Puniceispirillum sp.]|nr:hypothetical protein [Candidatus Puniceispirillum sp.]
MAWLNFRHFSVLCLVLWTGITSYTLMTLVHLITGLRVDQGDEIEGLGLRQHGERGSHTG